MTMDMNILPAPDDLAGWKMAEHVLSERISYRIQSSHLVDASLFRQYFGCKNVTYLLDKYADLAVVHAFTEWVVDDYRPVLRSPDKKKKGKSKQRRKVTRKRGKTLAEKMLAAGLPAAEAKVLEECSQANPSIFRIISVEPGVSLTIEDILLGGKRLIHDKMLSGCVQPGQCLTGRAFPAGQFYFFTPMGPILPNILVMEAADYLKSLGVEFTHEGLLRDANKFGWLWDWYDNQSSEGYMPQLSNTDGEKLLWQTASFSIADEQVVREALTAREDIDYDDENDEYLWFRYQGKDAVIPGDTLSLGRMRFVMDELILDVNSAERLIAARKWLEKISGVKYQGVRTQDITDMSRDIPMDDRMGSKESIEMTPELASSLNEYFHEHYMKWLDMPLPVLDGKTPRQTCKTEAGRQKVAMLIRTTSPPAGNASAQIDIPRQEMFRSLGLESE